MLPMLSKPAMLTNITAMTRLLLVVTTVLFAAPALAKTTLFEVSDGESRILLGGTIHLLHPSEYPLPEAFDAAYEEADSLYLEADLAAIEAPAFGQQLMQAMAYPAGKNLQSELSPETWERVKTYSEKNQFPIQQFLGFDPAFVSMIMTVTKAQSEGITDGVDEHYYQKAKAEGKTTGHLESPEDILAYMKAVTGIEADAVMEATLVDLERFDELMETMVDAWKRGDMQALDRDLGQPMREEAPEVYQTLLVDRNAKWLPRVIRLFEQEGTELVLVGSLHLAGKDSLLDMLEREGYRIRPYEVQ